MKKLLAPFAFLMLAASFQPAFAQFGISAGLNYDELGQIQAADRQATFDNAKAWHVGVFYDLGAGMVAVRPGVFYRDYGDVSLSELGQISRFDLTAIEIPVDVRIKPLPMPLVKPYLVVGPVLTFARSGDQGFNDALEDMTLSANAGVGFEMNVLGLTLFPELRFAFGVNRFLKEGESIQVGSAIISAEEMTSQQNVMLRLGLTL